MMKRYEWLYYSFYHALHQLRFVFPPAQLSTKGHLDVIEVDAHMHENTLSACMVQQQ